MGKLNLKYRHRLLCGDSTNLQDVERLMAGEKADMVFTDPPYNADYKSRGSKALLRKGIKNDSMSDEAFEKFIHGFLSNIIAGAKPGSSLYVCCNWKDSYPRFYRIMSASTVNVSACIVWNKGSGGMGWQDYRYQYEFILYGFLKNKSHNWSGGRAQTDLWDFNRDARSDYTHPTQKPVILIEKAINNSCKTSESVLDLFGGSGSTMIACEKTGRKCRMMELDPIYCDVILQRWSEYSGNKY